MLTPKQKAYLKSLAHPLKSCFQIGKDGLSENLLKDVLNYLHKHELMKISVLKNASVTYDEVEAFFAQENIETVQVIGRVIILYKHSDDVLNPIALPVRTR